jgi:hypothetical protein
MPALQVAPASRRSGFQRTHRHLDAAACWAAHSKAGHQLWRRQAQHHPPGVASIMSTEQQHQDRRKHNNHGQEGSVSSMVFVVLCSFWWRCSGLAS